MKLMARKGHTHTHACTHAHARTHMHTHTPNQNKQQQKKEWINQWKQLSWRQSNDFNIFQVTDTTFATCTYIKRHFNKLIQKALNCYLTRNSKKQKHNNGKNKIYNETTQFKIQAQISNLIQESHTCRSSSCCWFHCCSRRLSSLRLKVCLDDTRGCWLCMDSS